MASAAMVMPMDSDDEMVETSEAQSARAVRVQLKSISQQVFESLHKLSEQLQPSNTNALLSLAIPRQDENLYVEELKALEQACMAVAGQPSTFVPGPATDTVPPNPAGGGFSEHHVKLWQLGYRAADSMKGPSPQHFVARAIANALVEGNHDYIEVLFRLHGAKVGDPVHPFSIGLENGTATVTAAHCVCYVAVTEKWSTSGLLSDCPSLAGRLLRCLNFVARHAPKASMKEQAYNTLYRKVAASQRSRPNPLQMLTVPDP
jgi:hypothetical protein